MIPLFYFILLWIYGLRQNIMIKFDIKGSHKKAMDTAASFLGI